MNKSDDFFSNKKIINKDRMEYAMEQLEIGGIEVTKVNDTTLRFQHNRHTVTFYPYTGWHTGKSIKDGRGIHKLLSQVII